MPYSNIEDRRRVSRESQRRRRRRSGGIIKGGSTPDVNPVVYRDVNPSDDLTPLAEMEPWDRRRAIRKATMVTMGLTREAYEEHLENRVSSLEAWNALLEERVMQLSYRVAILEADSIDAPTPEELEAMDEQ